MKESFEKEERYTSIRDTLVKQKKEGKTSVLNVHIPGTGCGKEDGLPTREALDTVSRGKDIAAIYLHGAGSEGKPALNKENTLETVLKKPSHVKGFWGFLASEPDAIAQTPTLHKIFSIVTGAGRNSNTVRVLNTLEELEKEKVLPEVMYLSGHSRGSINCISLANAIYLRYGSKIKLHLCLTDPVPGPGYEGVRDTYTIPPNVVSFTSFYAKDEDRFFFKSRDLNQLIFTNPTTTVTSHAFKGNHVSFFRNDEITDYIVALTAAVNEVDYEPPKETKAPEFLAPEVCMGEGSRAGQLFSLVTPVNKECCEPLQKVLGTMQQTMNKSSSPEIKDFTPDTLKDFKEREAFLQKTYKNPNSAFSTNHQVICSIKLDITLAGFSNITRGSLYSVSEKRTSLAQEDRDILKIIEDAEKKAKGNINHKVYGEALAAIYTKKISHFADALGKLAHEERKNPGLSNLLYRWQKSIKSRVPIEFFLDDQKLLEKSEKAQNLIKKYKDYIPSRTSFADKETSFMNEAEKLQKAKKKKNPELATAIANLHGYIFSQMDLKPDQLELLKDDDGVKALLEKYKEIFPADFHLEESPSHRPGV